MLFDDAAELLGFIKADAIDRLQTDVKGRVMTARKLLFVHGVRFAALLVIGGGSVHDLPGSRQLNVQQTIKNERCCGSPTRHNEDQDMFLLTAVSFANLSSESFTSESLPECTIPTGDLRSPNGHHF